MSVGVAKHALDNALYCGDECGYWPDPNKDILCMADGLGHGKHAQIAAKSAVSYVSAHVSKPLLDIFSGCDKAIHHTRGVAMGICAINKAENTLSFGGISNTRAMIFGKSIKNLSSHYGIIGAGYKTLTIETVPIETGDLVVMFTDGLPETINITAYNQGILQDLSILAQQILNDFSSGKDDAAVLVYKCP